jgi:DHA2 family methylenomycin A resistance protein-like MFS transporter
MGQLQWVVNSYTLVFAGFLLTCGAIGDRFGARSCYQIGLLLFTVMSLLCALSPSAGVLIAIRVFQGLGAAIMLPASLSLLAHTFPHPDEKARAVAFWAGIVSLGFAAGPALGGLLTSLLGWRSIFWINVPIGLLAFAMVRRFVSEARVPNPRSIDWAAQAAAVLALFCLTYGLIDAGNAGWAAPRVLLAFALTGLLFVAFGLIERRSVSPALPRALFSNALFSVCVAVGAVLNFGMYGILFIESIYLQNARHLDALYTGMMILPFTVLPTITTRMIVRYSGRKHIKLRLIWGQLIAAVGAGTLILSLWTSGYWAILLGLAFLGVAMGCIMPAMTTGVLTASTADTSGSASGILNSARQVGGAVGVALMGTLVQSNPSHGYVLSFGLTTLGFLLMSAVTLRAIKNHV